MHRHHIRQVEAHVYADRGRHFILVPSRRVDELRLHLGSHGIHCGRAELAAAGFERVEVELSGELDVYSIQALLDYWEG